MKKELKITLEEKELGIVLDALFMLSLKPEWGMRKVMKVYDKIQKEIQDSWKWAGGK